jgi:response regulator RpfG family c-di-GMP phosphodiesterase
MEHPTNIVISDHNMPRVSGVEFVMNVRNLFPRTVRIVMSGAGSTEMLTDAVNAAAIDRYLSKNGMLHDFGRKCAKPSCAALQKPCEQNATAWRRSCFRLWLNRESTNLAVRRKGDCK